MQHARVLTLTADDGCNVADKAILAIENFPTVAALGLSVFELGA
jgi:hypothetical protein